MKGEFRGEGHMGRTETNSVLSGLEGDPCGRQGLDSPPIHPEMEQQQEDPQVKNLVSHFATSAFRG